MSLIGTDHPAARRVCPAGGLTDGSPLPRARNRPDVYRSSLQTTRAIHQVRGIEPASPRSLPEAGLTDLTLSGGYNPTNRHSDVLMHATGVKRMAAVAISEHDRRVFSTSFQRPQLCPGGINDCAFCEMLSASPKNCTTPPFPRLQRERTTDTTAATPRSAGPPSRYVTVT